MLRQAFASESKIDDRGAPDARAECAVSMLSYRSRAVSPPSNADLERLLDHARERNHREGLTGLLIYDAGNYFQWLEGPEAGLGRVWDSIRRDARHQDAQVLRTQRIPKRFFGSWDMRLMLPGDPTTADSLTIVNSGAWMDVSGVRPALLPASAWDDIFSDLVVPALRAAHCRTPGPVSFVWHAARGVPAMLATRSLGLDAEGISHFIDGLVEQGAGIESLYAEVFEPAARHLGNLWSEDETTDAQVSLGLHRMQTEIRRLRASIPHPLHVIKPGHAVLVAPQPGEPHGITAAMSSEMFWRDGWDVTCEFPCDDRGLGDLVRASWFDVLDLSLSGVHLREHGLRAMGRSIRTAQAASQNPALAVMVNGRTFFERRHAYFGIGADAACGTVVDSVATAQRLLDATTTQRRIEQSFMDPPRSARSWSVAMRRR